MDKLLAMSILSAGPDSSLGDWWLSYLPSGDHLKKKNEAKNEKEMCSGTSGGSKDSNSKHSSGKVERPRFAMEFDGLNCFENIVSH